MSTGAFTTDFAQHKKWKLDEKLFQAILHVLTTEDSTKQLPVIDLGAGMGRYVQALRNAGFPNVYGADGIKGINEMSNQLVFEVDLTEQFVWQRTYTTGPHGWRPAAATCIEVGEHVPEQSQMKFLDCVADSVKHEGILIVSYATCGQRGRDHVSCHSPEWVASHLGQRGCVVLEEETAEARRLAGKGWNRKLLVLRRYR